MTASSDRLGELRLGDLTTFLAVRRTGSVTSAARELRVTPSQVSKAVARLEGVLGLQLLSRSSRGVMLSEAGERVVPHIESAMARLRQIGRPGREAGPELTVAAPSYLLHAFLPAIAARQPQLRVRGLELPPALVRAYAAENFFDLSILPIGSERMPPSWVSTPIGDLHKGVFATPALAKTLGPIPVSVERLATIPFISPIYNADGRFVTISDDCPLAISDRTAGHEAQTIFLALELAARTDQLVFGPRIAARRFLEAGTLVEIRVRGWKVSEPLHVSCNADRVLSSVQKAIVGTLRTALLEASRRAT